MKGVTTSRLLDLANQQDQRNVPIGSPYLVNSKERISKDVRRMIGSQELITPNLSQFTADGYDNLEVGRDVTLDEVDFNGRRERGALRIVEGSYNSDTGELILIRANKEQIVMRDLLRVDQLGIGRVGPRGMPAHNGDDGFDGCDGQPGQDGCEGPRGQTGRVGPPGPEGEDGFEGEQGPSGCEGAIGQPGQAGPAGRHGFEGPRGLPGPSCNAAGAGARDPQGPAGPAGPAFGEGVWFGQAGEAPSAVAIVGLPDDGVDSPVGAPGTGVLPNPKPIPPPAPALPNPKPNPDPEPPPPIPVPDPEPPSQPVPVGPGDVKTCNKMPFGEARKYCNGNVDHWGVACVIKEGAHRVGPAYGISTMCSYNNTKNWMHSLVFCGQFTVGAEFSYEFTVPKGITATFQVGCRPYENIYDVGGTFRGTFVGERGQQISVRMRGSTIKIPVWFALVVKNSAGKVVYYTGMNRSKYSSTTIPSLEKDDNWFTNSVMQTIGNGDY